MYALLTRHTKFSIFCKPSERRPICDLNLILKCHTSLLVNHLFSIEGVLLELTILSRN